MDSVLRALVIYVALLFIMRVTGKRSLAQITVFDFVLLLIIGEATGQALLGDDFSITSALIVIITLVTLDLFMSLATFRFARLGRFVNGVPLVVVIDGEPLMDRMNKERLSVEDVLEEARKTQGIERMEQIKFAVLEKNGVISVIPKSNN